MKKMKKLFAILMTMAMVMGLGITGFAAKPTESITATGTVKNVEAGATVKAYQIVEGNYNDYGLTGYSVVEELEGHIDDELNPTVSELSTIAKSPDLLASLVSHEMTAPEGATTGLVSYSSNELTAGYWLVLVEGGKNVYNPMLLGIYYTGTGSDGTLTGDDLDAATDKWELENGTVYAKSSKVPITKTAVDTADLGEAVKFTIDTTVPYYTEEYDLTSLVFEVSDKLTNLELIVNSTNYPFSVEKATIVDGETTYTPIADTDYTYGDPSAEPVTEGTSFKVSFNSDWISQNGGADIRITYYATLEEEALNTIPGSNDATVTYTNDPSETTDSNKDTEKVYTFDIDGDVTGNILKKVKPGTLEGSTEELNGAEFTLYTNSACTDEYIYENSKGEGKATSDSSGKIAFTGLAAGTYYLKETAAPSGYTLNDTVYEIIITANIQNEELVSWTYAVKPYDSNEAAVTSTFNVSGGTATAAEGNITTEIMNTTLTELPSTGGMGTTLFTIAGCVIMISAVGLFFATRKKAN